MRKGRIAAAAALTTMGLALSACGGEGDADAGQQQNQEQNSAPASSSAPAESSEPADGGDVSALPVDDEVTAPGTTLEVGERAVVPFEYTGDKKGTVAITVTDIKKGSHDDLPKKSDGSSADERITPYYIEFTVENVGGDELKYSRVDLDGRLAGGDSTGAVLTVMGGVDQCESESAPSEFDEQGASYESCTIQGSARGDVTEVHFTESPDYEENPVVWTK
ncbi:MULTISPECIES: hypothetical protein [Prauserella salsuginis group]|uniref:DUF4352 domain-containing protein n=2 Tax=Prauserella salsuginis group TaxID=2893672 RepID=A0A839Y354_9PSEU|nr:MULTISPECIES: hypothetical protein [Prauserella salsuginis group]MBB3666345.1 hypothetical protein [Prauserella sediminis]MCR3718122.1 hypothetical protein [Prauserella flava]MCR3732692.1 hypothetical protein [Prauserella salsuginis]